MHLLRMYQIFEFLIIDNLMFKCDISQQIVPLKYSFTHSLIFNYLGDSFTRVSLHLSFPMDRKVIFLSHHIKLHSWPECEATETIINKSNSGVQTVVLFNFCSTLLNYGTDNSVIFAHLTC